MDEPRSPWPGDAGNVLLRALLRLAREREDVRVALTRVQGWLAEELAVPSDGGEPEPEVEPEVEVAGASEGLEAVPTPTKDAVAHLPLRVITPYTQARSGDTRSGDARSGDARSGDARSSDARSSDARSSDARSGDARDGPDPRGSERSGFGPREEGSRPARKVELPLVVRRARWKAAACRLALDLRSAPDAGPEDKDLRRLQDGLQRRHEELEECATWMLDPSLDVSDGSLADAAACFETLALVAEGLVELENASRLEPAPSSELLYLLAETQSALLAAVHACDQRGDSDQRDLFLWLKDQTARHRIYVDRHRRLDDPADPARSEERGQRFRELSGRLLRGHNQRQFRGQLLNKIRFHVGKAREAEEAGDHADHGDHDWDAVGSGAEEWLRLGLPPEDEDLLALLRPLVEEFAGTRTLPESLARLIRVREAPATGALEPETSALEPETRASSGDGGSRPRPVPLDQVAGLLEGRRAVIFVRDEDTKMREPLAAALHLTQINWVELPAEEPLETLAREIRGVDVDLVLITEHLPEEEYAEFKRLCLASGRPFVRLPDGLEPNRVAHQVLRQVGWRLRDRSAATRS